MRFHPTRIPQSYFYLFSALAFIVFSCAKDNDIFTEKILGQSVDEIENGTGIVNDLEENTPNEPSSEDNIESRLATFPTINDAHVQSGIGYNQDIIRLEEDHRTSYLMFDLSPIDSISGNITQAILKFTINSDDGNGIITINKGTSTDWSEFDLSLATAPETEIQLGEVTKEYKVGVTEEIELDAAHISNEKLTLVLNHGKGNDLAFASKEHPMGIGPTLDVTYSVPLGTKEIEIPEPEVITPPEEENPEEEGEENSNEAPIAIADATPSTGGAPLEVTFTGSNSTDDDTIATFAWNFDDGTSSSEADPVHTFNEVGTYEVVLTTVDAEGLSNTDTVTITVNEESNAAPVAVVTANPSTGEAPLEVQFVGNKSTDDNSIASYSYDFKDGSTASNANPSHAFDEPGTYNVVFTVKDENGLEDQKTITITVTAPSANEAPVAVITTSTTSGQAPLDVQFTGNSSTDDNEISSYFWDFKDGSTTTNINPSHAFNNAGTYEVELTVTDADGLSSTQQVTITVEADGGGNSNTGNYPSNAVFASDFGYNASDATEAFKAALNSGSSFVVIDKQSSDWIVGPTKFFDLRDMTIIFEEGVVLRAKSGAFPKSNDELFELVRGRNILIEGYGAILRMNKSEYTSGEHRHAFALKKCNSITVKGLKMQDSGGDGIIIAGLEVGTYSENITIQDVTAQNNRRQGMSIISAQNVWVSNSKFIQTNGVNPESGVDLEPNYASERLVNINFSNCEFSGNDSHGFLLTTGKLNGSSTPISVNVSDSEFSFNTRSPESGVPRSEILLSQGSTNDPVGGQIKFERILFNGSNRRIIFSKKSAESYSAIFKDCVAKNVSSSGSRAVIELQALSTVNTLGGFVFENFTIEYTNNVPFMQINAPSSGLVVKDVIGDFKIKEPNDNPLDYTGGYNVSNNINVNIDYQHIN